VTRYVEAFSWPSNIETFIREVVTERPVLNACAGRSSFGDTRVDLYEPADLKADWRQLPFPPNSYGAVFAYPPWDATYKRSCATFIRKALKIAPVVYLMAPWVYGAADVRLTRCWVRQHPGVNTAILICRYERAGD
jgi:hypothetical protein